MTPPPGKRQKVSKEPKVKKEKKKERNRKNKTDPSKAPRYEWYSVSYLVGRYQGNLEGWIFNDFQYNLNTYINSLPQFIQNNIWRTALVSKINL